MYTYIIKVSYKKKFVGMYFYKWHFYTKNLTILVNVYCLYEYIYKKISKVSKEDK